jgi:signal transduction histidine kinase/DNA-binding response OmpR family regulator
MKIQQLFLLLFLGNILFAQQGFNLELEGKRQVMSLDKHSLLYVDSTGSLGLDQIRDPAFQSNFLPLDSTAFEAAPGVVFWLKVPLATQDSLRDWLLVLKRTNSLDSDYQYEYLPGNDLVDVWFVAKNNNIQHRRTGMLVPASEKIFDENSRINAVKFPITAVDSLDLFVRVQNNYGAPVYLSAELRAPDMPLPLNMSESVGQIFLFMGVTGILSLLSFFFFLFVRDQSYLLFGFFAGALALHYTILHPGVVFIHWFVPEHPWLVEYAWIMLTHGAFICFTLFGRSFVGLRERYRRLDNIMLVLTGIMFFSMLGSIIILPTDLGFSFIPLFFVAVLGVILIGFRLLFLPDNLAKIFGIGAVWLCFFSVYGILWEMGMVPSLFNPWLVSQLGMMIIYTFGLAYKLHLNEEAKAEARQVLELDAVKSRFFANISHEFRTPLTLIQGPLKKAQEQLPASDQELFYKDNNAEISLPARHIGMMRRNTERLEQLIDQLLDLSKLENGSMKLQVAEGDIIPFLRAMVFSFESLAEQQQIHFHTAFPEPGQRVFFDRDKLEKITVNLLSNAFKYTSERGRVSVHTVLESGRLKFSVEDSGPGILKEDLDKIFDRFYQIEGTEDKGTGIGLSLVKELVELHRGQIHVESAEGKGTVFKVSLPVLKESFTEKEIILAHKELDNTVLPNRSYLPIEEAPSDEKINKGNQQAATLLIVEDNPDLRRFIGETMQGEYRILTAKNGKEGLTTALDHIPDLVVSDVMMPEMDGFTFCEKLKSDERTSHIPVILLTARVGQEHKVEGLETGADAYLTKPFDEAELLVRARKLIENRRQLRERFASMGVFGRLGNLSSDTVTVVSADERFLQKVINVINENISNEYFSVEDLADAVAFSRSQLHRKLKAITDKSATELIREMRLTRAKELLEQGYGNVSEVAMEVGYSSLSYFAKSFKSTFGRRPSEV